MSTHVPKLAQSDFFSAALTEVTANRPSFLEATHEGGGPLEAGYCGSGESDLPAAGPTRKPCPRVSSTFSLRSQDQLGEPRERLITSAPLASAKAMASA